MWRRSAGRTGTCACACSGTLANAPGPHQAHQHRAYGTVRSAAPINPAAITSIGPAWPRSLRSRKAPSHASFHLLLAASGPIVVVTALLVVVGAVVAPAALIARMLVPLALYGHARLLYQPVRPSGRVAATTKMTAPARK
jgi:hypothetical protein